MNSLFGNTFESFEAFELAKLKQDGYAHSKRFGNQNFRRRSTIKSNLAFSAFGKDYKIKLFKPKPILHPDVKIETIDKDHVQRWDKAVPDCFSVGTLGEDWSSNEGHVSLSHCDGLEGRLSTKDGDFHIKEVPHGYKRHLNISDDETVLVVAKEKRIGKNTTLNNDDNVSVINDYMRSLSSHTKRAEPHRPVTVELAVYTDSLFTKRLPSKDPSKRIELMIMKYNGVQLEWSRSDALGYDVNIQIKYIGFYKTDPPFYKPSNLLGEILGSFCNGMRKNHIRYDLIFLNSGLKADVTGRAFQASACSHNYRCGVVSSPFLFEYRATAHEIGHSLGMRHDKVTGCTGSDVGLLGGYGAGWSSCNIKDLDKFLQSSNARCLYEENVEKRRKIHYDSLKPILIGQEYSVDEVCEKTYGPNFRFRKFPHVQVCGRYSCTNLNEGPLFGQMFTVMAEIPGSYCDPGKICFNWKCVTFERIRQPPGVVRPGGWGPWTDWHPCSRTCGTGLTYRRRACNNPSPLNSEGCEGGNDKGYEAKICNTQLCPNDSMDTNLLIKQRASETCHRLLTNGALNSSLYSAVGSIYNPSGQIGQCEVLCAPVPGYKMPEVNRFGLMPQGTACAGDLDKMDANDWPRRPGYTARCLDGYCQLYKLFGCDGVMNGGKLDGCGVCSGNGTSCDVVEGIFTELSTAGTRKVIAKLPVGAYNIQFWFNYKSMPQNFLEVYSKDGAVVLSSLIGSSWIWYTLSNPVTFAGTYWHYNFYEQFLHAKGPITEPAIIKVHQNNIQNNTGIQFAYSLPKSVKTCTGSCSNGGTFNRNLCACDCPRGFYGNNCTSRCNKFCYNGATVDQSTCACQCKEHQIGLSCKCESGYTGINCTMQK